MAVARKVASRASAPATSLRPRRRHLRGRLVALGLQQRAACASLQVSACSWRRDHVGAAERGRRRRSQRRRRPPPGTRRDDAIVLGGSDPPSRAGSETALDARSDDFVFYHD